MNAVALHRFDLEAAHLDLTLIVREAVLLGQRSPPLRLFPGHVPHVLASSRRRRRSAEHRHIQPPPALPCHASPRPSLRGARRFQLEPSAAAGSNLGDSQLVKLRVAKRHKPSLPAASRKCARDSGRLLETLWKQHENLAICRNSWHRRSGARAACLVLLASAGAALVAPAHAPAARRKQTRAPPLLGGRHPLGCARSHRGGAHGRGPRVRALHRRRARADRPAPLPWNMGPHLVRGEVRSPFHLGGTRLALGRDTRCWWRAWRVARGSRVAQL
jgi:hypothetical protein